MNADDAKACGACGNVFSGYGNVCPACGARLPEKKAIPAPVVAQIEAVAANPDSRRAWLRTFGIMALQAAVAVSGVVLYRVSDAEVDTLAVLS